MRRLKWLQTEKVHVPRYTCGNSPSTEGLDRCLPWRKTSGCPPNSRASSTCDDAEQLDFSTRSAGKKSAGKHATWANQLGLRTTTMLIAKGERKRISAIFIWPKVVSLFLPEKGKIHSTVRGQPKRPLLNWARKKTLGRPCACSCHGLN